MTNFLYIGSGNSAKLVQSLDMSEYIVVCANNAWRLFQGRSIDVWLHSGDFPKENYPIETTYHREVTYKDYAPAVEAAAEVLGWQTRSPQHYAGYTVFFQGLYWLLMQKPKSISLLGFDHDYNMGKLRKWERDHRPNIQNRFNGLAKRGVQNWQEEYFKGFATDFFYGHGTPDPMRLGADHLRQKFQLAVDSCERLGIELANLSPVESDLNIVKKVCLPIKH